MSVSSFEHIKGDFFSLKVINSSEQSEEGLYNILGTWQSLSDVEKVVAPNAQKDLRLQNDFSNSYYILEIINKFVENYCHRRISASCWRNSLSIII